MIDWPLSSGQQMLTCLRSKFRLLRLLLTSSRSLARPGSVARLLTYLHSGLTTAGMHLGAAFPDIPPRFHFCLPCAA
jgi:hypothetical protein